METRTEAMTTETPTKEDTAAALVFRDRRGHPESGNCPVCGEDVTIIGLNRVVYAFAVCEHVGHMAHIYEQLWHRQCFIDNNEPIGW